MMDLTSRNITCAAGRSSRRTFKRYVVRLIGECSSVLADASHPVRNVWVSVSCLLIRRQKPSPTSENNLFSGYRFASLPETKDC